jgi:UDP-2,4-diacetamido-2,4,6-trideoxy-beta-L-altropyranose hydrolase
MKIAFRADASVAIGTGHVMRCLALADAVARWGGDVAFLTAASAGPLISAIRSRGYQVSVLQQAGQNNVATAHDHPNTSQFSPYWERDADWSISALARFGCPDWLVVDHYGLDARWEAKLRANVHRILAIDDLANRSHVCDLLLDQNYVHAMDTRYRKLVPASCTQLLGPRFALLRREFLEQRHRMRPRDGSVRNILLGFGGADPGGETSKALRALLMLNLLETVIVVVAGALNPYLNEIQDLCAQLPRAILHPQVDNMADLMADADLAIGAGGSTTWERCCLGLPTITIATADNQELAMARMSEEIAVLHLGRAEVVSVADIASAIAKLMGSPDLCASLAQKASAIADGEGANRVCASMGLLPPAKRSQIDTVFPRNIFEMPSKVEK